MKNFIFLISFILGFSINSKASTIDVNNLYKKSFSSTIGFFGGEFVISEGLETNQSSLKTQFYLIQISHSTFRSFDFDSLFPVKLFTIHTSLYNSSRKNLIYYYRCNLVDSHLFKLFNNYRI